MDQKKQRRAMTMAAVLAAVLAASTAYALVEEKHLSPTMRELFLSIPSFPVPTSSNVTAGTAGVAGVVTTNATSGTHVDAGYNDAGAGADAAASLDGGNYIEPTIAAASLYALPYPSKVEVVLIDGGSATSAALTCSSVTLRGLDQFGAPISETVTSVTETPKYTTGVFSSISAVSTSRCANGNDASDVLRLAMSRKIGLGRHIRQAADVVSYCRTATATGIMACSSAADIASNINVASSTLDLSATTPSVADKDLVTIRVLPLVPLP